MKIDTIPQIHLNSAKPPPSPLCGHSKDLLKVAPFRSGKIICGVCGSFWDQESLDRPVEYGEKYANQRSHFDEAVGRLKIKSLQDWLVQARLNLEGKTVCEVGFGGAYCLSYLQTIAGKVFGIEASASHLAQACALGLKKTDLFQFKDLPDLLPDKVELWVFQDSFEHLPDPSAFMKWMENNSADTSAVLIVAPQAASTSERFLGKFWPHRLPDHRFHWSREGLLDFFSHFNYTPEREWNPRKHVSLGVIWSHLGHKFGKHFSWLRAIPQYTQDQLVLRFNIGEMGILLRKNPKKK